jgi:DNA-directed RNA polymerase subunit RPC12/RpoP
MPEHFIHLNCANCGAKLEVYDDMERFACGYCGTELLVQRRGRTVALNAVTEVIKKIQIGTDKTAAELALVRLNQESAKLDDELQQLVADANFARARDKAKRDKAETDQGYQFIAAGLVGLVGVVTIIAAFVSGPFEKTFFAVLVLGLLLAGAGVLGFRWAYMKEPRLAKSDKLARIEKQVLEKQAELAQVNSRIAENRRIVDS